jgi:hypothetical protein
MRHNYKKGKLTDIRIEILNNIEGWKWVDSENRAEIISRTFEENLGDWIRQFELLGRTPNKRSKDDDEKRTGIWQSGMRQNYKKGKLTDIRIEILNNIEGWKWEGNSK